MKNLVASVILFLVVSANLQAQKSAVFIADGEAIRGYDAVAFFKESKPVIGDKKFAYTWNSAEWLFANQEDLEMFKASPEKYAPQFGGYCAYGTSAGHKAPTQTDTWTVLNDKLYFNYNLKVQEMWKKDQANLIQKANKNWEEIKDKE